MQLNYDTFSNKKRTVNFITENVIILIHTSKSIDDIVVKVTVNRSSL